MELIIQLHLVFLGLVVLSNAKGRDRAIDRPVYRVGRCFLTPEPGVCNDKVIRWYYNVASERCKRFVYSGCGGNANNFYDKDFCEEVCLEGASDRSPGSSMKPLFLYHKKELYVPHSSVISKAPLPAPTKMKRRRDRYNSNRRSKPTRRNIELIPIRKSRDRDGPAKMNSYLHNLPPTVPLPRTRMSGGFSGQNGQLRPYSYSRTNLYPTGSARDQDRYSSSLPQRRSFTVVSLYMDPKPNISPSSNSGFPTSFFNSQSSHVQRPFHPLRRMMPMLFNLPWLLRYPMTSPAVDKSNEDIVTDGLLSRLLFRAPLPAVDSEEITVPETTDFLVVPSSTPKMPMPEAKIAPEEVSLTTRPPPRPEHNHLTTTPLPQGPHVEATGIENPVEYIPPPTGGEPGGRDLEFSTEGVGTYPPFSPEPGALEIAPPGVYSINEASTPTSEYSDSSDSSDDSVEHVHRGQPLTGPVGLDVHEAVLMPEEPIGKMGGEAARFDRSICFLPMDPGPCRAAIPQWFYNSIRNKCEFFFYGGCLGMPNRFETEESCASLCGKDTDTTTSVPQTANANPKPPVKDEVTKTVSIEPATTRAPYTAQTVDNKINEINKIFKQVTENREQKIVEGHANGLGKEALAGLVEAIPIRVEDNMEYATVIVIMCIVGIAIIVLFSLGLMYAIRRIKKTKKERVIEAVLRSHIYGSRPKLAFAGHPKASKA